MDNKTLKSSIKAYCLELMKEMNSLGGGGEGAYMTKFAGRKVTSKDKTSPTGFETSPKNNYYKKFKFRVTNPYPRKNSKQLWNEIKINKPGTLEFPIYLNNQEKAIETGKKLFKLDYRWVDANGTKPDWTNAPFKTNNFEPFKIFLINDNQKIIDYKYTDEIDHVQEIKIEKPIRKARVISGDGYDVLVYKSGVKYKDNPEEIDKSLMDQKLYYDFFDDDYKNSTTFSLISFIDGDKKEKIWWDDDKIRFGLNENKKEFIHRINKEIYQKLDEINNHIEYTSKIKGSEDKEINELNNLKNSLLKIKSKINEIKIDKPRRIWDFTKYIPNFDPKNIKVGDEIKLGDSIDKIIGIVYANPNDIQYFNVKHGICFARVLIKINNDNKQK